MASIEVLLSAPPRPGCVLLSVSDEPIAPKSDMAAPIRNCSKRRKFSLSISYEKVWEFRVALRIGRSVMAARPVDNLWKRARRLSTRVGYQLAPHR